MYVWVCVWVCGVCVCVCAHVHTVCVLFSVFVSHQFALYYTYSMYPPSLSSSPSLPSPPLPPLPSLPSPLLSLGTLHSCAGQCSPSELGGRMWAWHLQMWVGPHRMWAKSHWFTFLKQVHKICRRRLATTDHY